MTNRSRRYFWQKKYGLFFARLRAQVSDCFWETGMAGSHVSLSPEGKVHARILTIQEILDLRDKIDCGEMISDEYTITKLSPDEYLP